MHVIQIYRDSLHLGILDKNPQYKQISQDSRQKGYARGRRLTFLLYSIITHIMIYDEVQTRYPGTKVLGAESDILLLNGEQFGNALFGKVQQAIQSAAAEDPAFASTLHLNEIMPGSHDNVEIDLGPRILLIAKVEQELAVHNTSAHSRDSNANGTFRQDSALY